MNIKKILDAIPEGYALKKVNQNKYEVLKEGAPVYTLEKKQSNWTCDCPGFKHRKKCKHIAMLEDELPKRHPRAKLDEFVPEIESIMNKYGTWEIVGSYRRGKSDFKDIDILVTCDPTEFRKIEHDFAQDPNWELTMSGNDILRGKYKGYLMDVNRVNEEEYAPQLLYRTGSVDLNIAMRGRAKQMGYGLSERGLFDRTTKNIIARDSEQQIFNALNIDFIPPQEREKGSFEKYFK